MIIICGLALLAIAAVVVSYFVITRPQQYLDAGTAVMAHPDAVFETKPKNVESGETMTPLPESMANHSPYAETNEYYKMVNSLQNMQPGVDYVEYEVVSACDSKREGRKIASEIGGELKDYSDGVAVFNIPVKVYDFILMLAEANETAVTVSPNYMYHVSGEAYTN